MQVENTESRNRQHFCFRFGNQGRYGKTDAAIGFSPSNRSNYLSREVLTVDQGGCRWRLKIQDIRYVFASALGTRDVIGKRMAPLDSAHNIGLTTLSKDVLTA